ncbi:GNAT family N-acetyltransferase [Vibrio methylphosphonaticus]|uniref:GNAT family N-acetyltransferase n=1 Tax=Vibrio methylphosphonaticus TaxID=2946866 RepID=UPI00202A7D59|nr:GNAT family N-acetyltransferase [Vibrio methylphosphonaticus]MCL9776829.1 GNAT family N-acetyltransferase [Vibrio methylphosphonaticus]
MTGFQIRTMTKDDLEVAVEWASKEGWNPGLNDVSNYYRADPTGFLVGVLDGEPIACISVVRYDDSFGFLGFYIVKPEYRGLGYGWKIWQRGMAYLNGCNIGLDGVVEQQDNYRRSGFVLSHRNIRYEGITQRYEGEQNRIIKVSQLDDCKVIDYLDAFFPTQRVAFNRAWLNQPNSEAFAYLDGGDITGIGVARECHNGYKIAPLFADNAEVARQLYRRLISELNKGMPVYLDVPENNPAAVELAQQHQMTPNFETARMYSKSAPDIQLGRTYGVTSFEIG